MAYSAPRVQGKRLVIPGRAGPIIIVGTPAWFAWLEQATTFAFGERAILTACKEQDGHGGWHWRAYRDRAGGQRGVYLGKAAEITFDHLNAVAAQLLHDTTAGQRSSGEQHPAAPPSASLRVELLGGFHVYAGDQPVPDNAWRLHKAKSLVKLLALAPGYALHREQAQELLWPDLDPAAAANNLRQALYAARHALGGDQAADSSALQTRDERIHLAPTGGLWVDVAAFTTAAADAREGQDPAAYQTAVALYTGDLLPEDRYEDWAAGRREALCQSYLALLNTLAGLLEDRGDYPAAAATFEQVLAHEPADEEAHTRLMRVYALSGQRTRALRQYTLLRDALRHELDAAPDAASQRLYHAILTRRFPATSATTLPTADPASRALTAARHNLPTPLTSFVGRGRERAALARRLLPSLGDAVTGPRLITLTGAGGVGKSRLALAVANTLAARYTDGVWLVELATLTDPALVPAAVAAALGVNTPGRPLADTLLEHARSKTLLLVLDNCEHLAGACARLAGALLAACPHMRLLATSRLALRVPGEAIWRVSPLEAPDPTQAPTLAVLRDVPAVRLFVERARFVQPDFALSAANAAAVTEICRRLDGLPLAIELAAARLAVLSPMQLATRLDSALGLLGDRDQATPAHQRTLRATLDWSYALLGERERRLLRRLATFVGGWTLEAAEAVGASAEADGLPPRAVLPLLARLVDHSLVGVEARGDAARYQLLETVRQYAAEQLAASGEIALVEQRHATYYLALAEAAEPQLTGAAQVGWFDRLEREHANLLTALDNLRAAGATESWARLGVALWRFWETRGHLGEGLRRLETIMAAQDVPAVLRGKASSRAASLLRARGDLARSDTLYRQTLALWQDLGEARGAAVALANLGINAEYRSDVTAAAAFHQESLARFTALDDQRGIAAELNNLANIRADAGDLAEATVLYERAITLAHTLGQPPDAYAIGNLGNIAYRRGDYGRAVTRLEEAVALLRQRDDRPMLGHYLRYLGFAWRQYGDPVRAVAAFQEALDIDRALDAHSHWTADVLEGLASLLIAAGHSEDGARLFGAADTVREATTVPRRVFYANLYTHDVAMARAALGETAFATAWAAGRALSWSEAIAAAAIRVEAVTLPAATPPALSPREQQVAALIASGLTNAQIAATLGLSQRTADSHVHHILHKLGATSRATIAAWAANHNPVEAPHDQPLPGMSRHT